MVPFDLGDLPGAAATNSPPGAGNSYRGVGVMIGRPDRPLLRM